MEASGIPSRRTILAASAILVAVVVAVVYYQQLHRMETSVPLEEEEGVVLPITSTAFKDGERIPSKYTRDDEDLSPPLSWSGAPQGTKSYALIMDDPDAPLQIFTHWILFNLSARVESLPEGVPKREKLENGGLQGKNDFGEMGYGGPAPPPGKVHRYRFHLYALDTELELEPGASKQDVLKAMEGHVLAEGEITGTYSR
jgi:hypothetical protein